VKAHWYGWNILTPDDSPESLFNTIFDLLIPIELQMLA
jgi:hypothetical protein